MANTVATYLSQEGFKESKPGHFYSREINTSITSTATAELYDITVDEFTYKDIRAVDLEIVLDTIHAADTTARVVVLYNLQYAVLTKKIYPIKVDRYHLIEEDR